MRRSNPTRGLFCLIAAVGACLGAPAAADILQMNDGRRIEGDILSESGSTVHIDTVLAGIRASLTFQKADIKAIERAPIPEGFFDPPAPPRLSTDGAFQSNDTLYIEVPIRGRFGEQIFAEGITRAVTYARRHGIRHVVFSIDAHGGSLEESARAYQTLAHVGGDLTLHAVVRDCRGAPLAVALRCDTIFMLPGALIGGAGDLVFAKSDDASELDRQVIQSQIAAEVATDNARNGGDGAIIRAMLDPREELVVWTDDAGETQSARALPSGVPQDRVLLSVGSQELLVINAETAERLGVPTLSDGGVESIGPQLNLRNWKPESDYGTRAMDEARIKQERIAATLQTKFERDARINIERREKTAAAIDSSIRLAQEWDPFKGEYAKYDGVLRMKRGYLKVSGGSMRYTLQSQKDWTYRTNQCMDYLQQARRAISTMSNLDRDASKLGLEPTYEPGALDSIDGEIARHLDYLSRNRNRKED